MSLSRICGFAILRPANCSRCRISHLSVDATPITDRRSTLERAVFPQEILVMWARMPEFIAPSATPDHYRRSNSSQRLIVAVGVVLCLTSLGCTSWGERSPATDDVLASRRLSQQGIEASHRGQLNEAEQFLRSATDACPLDQHARFHFAEILWQRGDQSEAIAEMEEAQRLSGGDCGMIVRLGEMYLEAGRTELALTQAERVIDAGVESASAWALRGDSYLWQDNVDAALSSYYRSLSHQPQQPRLQLTIADLQRRHGRPERALSTLQHLCEQYGAGCEPTDLVYQEGLALKALGRYESAAERFRTVASREPQRGEFLYDLAEAELFAGHPAAARAAVQQAITLEPQRQEFHVLAARCAQIQQSMATQTPR